LVELRVAPPVQERIDTFAERANEGLLTADERAEYEALSVDQCSGLHFNPETQGQSASGFE
jgi:hypothetical protein